MKILVDENIPYITIQALRDLEHDVLDIRGTPDEGMKDRSLWALSQQEECLLITTDKGFSEHRNDPHYGILIVRLKQPNRQKIHRRIMQTFLQFEPDEWPGLLVVVRDYAQSIWRARKD
jgi:predicted nuclease of predicted toxin-antitoxin system